MRIPEIRVEFEKIRDELETLADRIAFLIGELKRRPPVQKTKPKSRSMSPFLDEKIRECREQNPDWSQAEIAQLFNVNSGRVSEVLAGRRE